MRVRILQILIAFVAVLIFSSIGYGQRNADVDGKGPTAPRLSGAKVPFRYVIVAGVSEVEKYKEQVRPALVVLMDDSAFSEANLIKLFELIGQRYAGSDFLSVDVFTSLKAIRTPEENDKLALWGPIENYRQYKYAFFVRNGYGEWFVYSIPGRVKEKEVWLKKPGAKKGASIKTAELTKPHP
jgi:hypothetical protein